MMENHASSRKKIFIFTFHVLNAGKFLSSSHAIDVDYTLFPAELFVFWPNSPRKVVLIVGIMYVVYNIISFTLIGKRISDIEAFLLFL